MTVPGLVSGHIGGAIVREEGVFPLALKSFRRVEDFLNLMVYNE
jgi:hypothetical protein